MCAYMPVSGPEPTREEIDARPGKAVLEFGAGWCPHCQAIQPRLKKLLDAHPEIAHIKVEDGKGKPLGRSFGVKLWPTLVFLRDGKAEAQMSRPDEKDVVAAFEALVK
jgi:thioredoxin 1